MDILKLIINRHRIDFTIMLILTFLSGIFGISVLGFINRYLLHAASKQNNIIWIFIGLLVAYFIFSIFAQVSLAKIGQRFIYDLRIRIIKQVLDTDVLQIETVGKSKILSSLSSDIRSISMAFTSLPNVVQGLLFFIGCCIYLSYLSIPLFLVTIFWLSIMIIGSYPFMLKTHTNFKAMRKMNDVLYKNYEEFLEGHRELLLNRRRSQAYYENHYMRAADKNRNYHVLADTWSAITNNWNNILMLTAVGCIFYLCAYRNWASISDAATFAMAILFMRQPLLSAVGAFPIIMQSQVAFNALQKLSLADFDTDFNLKTRFSNDWQKITLTNITYAHPAQSGQVFKITSINLSITRGETIFLIGANGSGKSTLSMLITGLYQADSGYIKVDNTPITPSNLKAYRQLFTSIFTDFHLFKELLNDFGEVPEQSMIDEWLQLLELSDKAIIKNGVVSNEKLSQGQKKRLALLSALLENHSILVLDEWAADQDPHFRKIFYEQLLPIFKEKGFTVFAISHDDKYFSHADRILEMDNGILKNHDLNSATASINNFS